MQRAQQPQRIGVPVERTIGAADHVRADLRQQLGDLGAVEEFVRVGRQLRLVVQPGHERFAGFQFLFRQAQIEAARTLVAHVDAGFVGQRGGEVGPDLGRALRPVGIGRHAEALALQPHQREIAARRPMRDVALVEHRDARADAAQPPGDRRADQPAADHGYVVRVAHSRPFPTNNRSSPYSRSSATITTKVKPISKADTAAISGSMLSWM